MFNNNKFKKLAITLAIGLAFSESSLAQMSTATIRGQVNQSGTESRQVEIIAVNKATGYSYKALASAKGTYVINGLAPGTYVLHVDGGQSSEVTVQVGETAALDLNVTNADSASTVVVVGNVARLDVISSEVYTAVSNKTIESMPQNSRNFLSFADLAPGVRFSTDPNSGFVTLQSGAASSNDVNVFIDGVSQKGMTLTGGISGADASRGNPFPQSAIAEYRVIGQGYKAEFDQVSSVAITAITKSGTNELHGDAFVDYTGSGLTALSPFDKANKAAGNSPATFKQEEYGMTLGGAIKEDVAHFFFSYEGKDIQTPRSVNLNQFNGLLPDAGFAASLYGMQGSHDQDFTENLLFAKVDFQLSQEQKLEISGKLRRESSLVAENYQLSAPGNDQNGRQDENRLNIAHTYTGDLFINEARFGYQMVDWNPSSASATPETLYYVSPQNIAAGATEVMSTGGSPNDQDRRQTGFTLSDEFTYTAIANNNIKTGIKFSPMQFMLAGTPRETAINTVLLDHVTGNPISGIYPGNPQTTLAAETVSMKDNQLGLYIQNDWKVTPKLEFDYGIRWDYESNMLNNDYATPADRLAMLYGQDNRNGAPVGQTYAQSLALGGVNVADFTGTGNRKPFMKAFAPRLGLIYDLNGDKASVFFAGLGRSYDRTMTNYAMDMYQNDSAPHGDTFLISNQNKMPYTDQFSMGLRQQIGIWNGEIGFTDAQNKDQFQWYNGNRAIDGGFGANPPNGPLWGSQNGYGNLVLGDFTGQSKTETIYLKMGKPYTKSSGWGLDATYTWSEGFTNNDGFTTNSEFDWTYGRASDTGNYPSIDIERQRLVSVGMVDLPWGVLLAGKATLGSGLPQQVDNCVNGGLTCFYETTPGALFRQFDASITKEINVTRGKMMLRADILNLFNTANYGAMNTWAGSAPGTNAVGGNNMQFGNNTGMQGPMRTVKVTLRYAF